MTDPLQLTGPQEAGSLAREMATALRNAVPILSKIAGDGIGYPRCAVRKLTTCPPTCRFGT